LARGTSLTDFLSTSGFHLVVRGLGTKAKGSKVIVACLYY
jgi:hypothetical protein